MTPGLRERARDVTGKPMRRVQLRGHLLHPYRRRRFHTFGSGSIVHKPMWIFGPHQISIGSDSLVLHQTWLSVEAPAWDLPAPVIRIGDRVGIRPYCVLSASESIVIED